MTKKFQKKVEDFVCEHCGAEVKGNGFTNHCPKCLWAKHVDINPGDRLSMCHGMMKPIEISKKEDKYSVIHECVKCGLLKPNKVSPEDDFEIVLKIAKERSDKNI